MSDGNATSGSKDSPADLARALKANKTAAKCFAAFPPSSKRIILEWIANAKRPEARQQRIQETVRLAARNLQANHYRQPARGAI